MGENELIKISVVVPVYTVSKDLLRECIESIINQTLKETEIVIVDDGAPAENGILLDEYDRSFENIHVIHQENRGVSAARNAGLKICKGKYVTFVDSDDTIDPSTLKKSYDFAEDNDLEILIFGTLKIYPDHVDRYSPFVEEIKLLNEKQKECIELKCFDGNLPIYEYPASKCGSGSCCAKLYRLDFLKNNGLHYPEGIERSEDVNFNLRAFEHADRLGYMNEFLYFYRQLSNSASYKYRDGGIKVFTGALELFKDFVSENNKPEYFIQTYYMRCMFFLLDSMKMDYLHPDNKKRISERARELRMIADTNPYKEAFDNLKYSNLSFAKKIPLFLIKKRLMRVLMLFCKVYFDFLPAMRRRFLR